MAHEVPDDLWSSFPHDPRVRANAPLRASDQDRERIVTVLATAFAEGRLDRDELEERQTAASTARTLGELPPLVSDLVPEQPPRPRLPRLPMPSRSLVGVSGDELERRAVDEWRDRRRGAVLAFFGSSVFFWVLWALINRDDLDGAFPWPVFVMLVAGLNALRVATSRDQIVRDEVRRLEKKQARQQRWPKGLT